MGPLLLRRAVAKESSCLAEVRRLRDAATAAVAAADRITADAETGNRRNVAARIDYAAMNGGKGGKGSARISDEVASAQRALVEAESEHRRARSELQEATRVKDANVHKLGPISADHLNSMARRCVQGAFDYYTRLYNSPGGDMYRIKIGFRGARVFNPLVLREMDLNASWLLIDDLALLGLRKFTPQFLDGMKAELPAVLAHAARDFDWSTVPGAADFDASIRRSDAAADVSFAWQLNPGEKARRIWEWWRARIRKSDELVFFKIAVRLVVLVQASSAAVERANSQLKRIFDVVGVAAPAETIEYRFFRAVAAAAFVS